MIKADGSSTEDVLRLIEEAKQGSAEATETLILNNLPLVRSIAKRYMGRAEFEDLLQIGSLGLLKAIRGFDASRGCMLSTYAVPMIAGEIKRFLRDDGLIKVSRRLKEEQAKISRLSQSIEAERGAPATVEELAAELHIEPCEVTAALEAAAPCRSIDERVYGQESEATLGDSIPAEGSMECEALERVLLRGLINKLPPKERQLIDLRYFHNMTQTETAKALGMTQVTVSRLEKRVLRLLREGAAEGY